MCLGCNVRPIKHFHIFIFATSAYYLKKWKQNRKKKNEKWLLNGSPRWGPLWSTCGLGSPLQPTREKVVHGGHPTPWGGSQGRPHPRNPSSLGGGLRGISRPTCGSRRKLLHSLDPDLLFYRWVAGGYHPEGGGQGILSSQSTGRLPFFVFLIFYFWE